MAGLFSRRQDKSAFESFFGDAAMRLIDARESEIVPRLESLMEDIGRRYGMDRVVLRWLPTEDMIAADRAIQVAVGWRIGGKPISEVLPHELPWTIEKLLSGETVYFETLDQVPSEIDRASFREEGILSIVGIPLRIDDDVIGVFTLACEQPYQIKSASRNEVESLANLIASAYWATNFRNRIRASEARYRAVVQDQSDLILRWTPDGTTTWVNDRMCEYLGRSADELIGKSELLFMTDDDWREFEEELSKLSPETPTFEYSHQWSRAAGKTVWTEWTERGIFDDEGQLIEVQSVGRDITKRKLAEATLQRQVAFQTRLAEISSRLLDVTAVETNDVVADILARIGIDYGLDRVNITWYDDALPGFGETMTWSPDGSTAQAPEPEEFPYAYPLIKRGETIRFNALDELPEAARVDRAQYEKMRVASLLAIPLRISDRVFGAAAFNSHQQRDWDDNTVDELQLIAHAITTAGVRQWSMVEISRREKDLARSQRVAKVGSYRMQATFNDDENSPYLLNILNLTMSDQALEICGIEAQADPRAQVMSLLAKIHPDDELRVQETWRKTLQAGTRQTLEYRIVRPDGSIAHVQARDQVDGTDSNGVTNFFGTCKDITQWVEANQKLQIALSKIEELKDQLQEENILLRDEVRAAQGFDKIIGNSRKLRGVLKSASQVAPTDVTVLICGETGTGKELLAQSIHDLSNRKGKPMVAVNCAALSTELIESELFGHEKGAFTGAHARRKGRFEIADGGTLFLDEIGELSGDLQAKLLRVIQEGEFERLGGSETFNTDVRLIAATNLDLVQAMDSGEFRADLYYRINAFPIDLPPLRERKDDIPMLAEHLVRKHAKILGKDMEAISARMLRYLQEQDWPGNIRELESAILRALISASGPVLDYLGGSGGSSTGTDSGEADGVSLLDAQRKHIGEMLERTNWVIEGNKGAARALGLAPSSLRSKMKRLNIVRPSRSAAS